MRTDSHKAWNQGGERRGLAVIKKEINPLLRELLRENVTKRVEPFPIDYLANSAYERATAFLR
jgi:hypothetical protein